jgi:hypothetical protein
MASFTAKLHLQTLLWVVVNCSSLLSGLCCEINSLTSLRAVTADVLLIHLCQQLIYDAVL